MASPPLFKVGEIAILQPPHPSAHHLRGCETRIISIHRSGPGTMDAMGETGNRWSYLTDIPAPPPTDLPHHQHGRWLWCEYDLRKRQEPGEPFATLLEALNDMPVKA